MRRAPLPLPLALAVSCALATGAASGCGSKRDNTNAVLAGVTMAAAVVAHAARESRRQRTESGYVRREDDAVATGQPWEPPPPPERDGPAPLPLWQVAYRVDVMAEDLWCTETVECERVEAVDCCPCARGGTALAVNRAGARRLREAIAQDCAPEDCAPPASPDASCAAEVACIDDLCRLLAVPPPPAVGEGPPPY